MGEPAGAGWREERTNSGESMVERCSMKRPFHGDCLDPDAGVVEDIVRRRWVRRWVGVAVAVALAAGLRAVLRVSGSMRDSV